MKNTRTATLTLSETSSGDELLSEVSEFDGESRYWEDVTITAVGGDVQVASMANGFTGTPSEDCFVAINEGQSREFASLDLESTYFKAGPDAESGSEEMQFEIVGNPASRPNG